MVETILLGVVQGLTEFLPVSSSGHLVLAQRALGMPETGLLLEILLHAGTLLAVFAVFWRDFLQMLRHPLRDRTLRLLILATIPAAVAALLFDDFIETAFGGWFLGPSFLVTAALMFAADWFGRRARVRGAEDGAPGLDGKQALAMGAMQALSIVPGISRSGATIAGGLAVGVSRANAAKFSFLMSAAAVAGSLVLKGKDLIGAGGAAFAGGAPALAAGVLAAALCGYAAIRWMLNLVRRASLKGFGVYTLVLGVLVLLDRLFFGLLFG